MQIFILVFLLKNTGAAADWMQAAITVRAAQCKGLTGTETAIASRFICQGTNMFFAPVIRRSYNPSFRSFDRSFERFVNDTFANTTYQGFKVEQDEKSWTVTLDVPGLAKEDLAIGIEGAVVRIDSKAEAKRAFKAAYELPQDIDAATSEAKLENGVLTLKLGKLVPVSNVHQLQVN
jgi:HSP20 family protein